MNKVNTFSIKIIFIFFMFSVNFASNIYGEEKQSFNQKIKTAPSSYLSKPGFFFKTSIYYKIWNMQVEIPMLSLKAPHKTFTIVSVGKSEKNNLKMKSNDGFEYKFRLFKNHHSIEDWLKSPPFKSFKTIIDGGYLLLFPYSSTISTFLANTLNILNNAPILYVFPKNHEYPYFSTKSGYLELQQKSKRNTFGAIKILKAGKFISLFNNNKAKLHINKYLQCRILDLFIGDGDRHAGQWKFVKFSDKSEWEPFPIDRDMAFLCMKGTLGENIINMNIDWKNSPYKYEFFSFGKNILNPIGLMCQAEKLDKVFFKNIRFEEIEKSINEFNNILTDDVIYKAVQTLPPEIIPIIGDFLYKSLVARKKELSSAMKIYFDYLRSSNSPLTTPP